jgi:hypothetical protein
LTGVRKRHRSAEELAGDRGQPGLGDGHVVEALRGHRGKLDVPEPVAIVNVFRAPDALPQIARQTVQIGAGALWCQFGVINEPAAREAEEGGVAVVMDRCIKVEHARYAGRMHWLGFNTHRITSVRAGLQ